MALTVGELLARLRLDDSEFEEGTERARGRFSGLGDHLKTAGLAAGVAGGAMLAQGLSDAMDLEAANAKLAAQLGATGDEAAQLGRIQGGVYSAGWGESLEDVGGAVSSVVSAVGDLGTFSDAEMQQMTASAMALGQAFEMDVGESATAAGALVKQGLVDNTTEAFDVLTTAAQTLPQSMVADLPAIVAEYGTHLARIGLDAETSFGLMSQYVNAGGRDLDQATDVLHEFGRISMEETDRAAEGFKGLGLDSKKMLADIGEGGPKAAGALQTTLDALRGVEDPAKRAQLQVALFGDMAGESADALLAMNPATAAAATGMDNTAGAAQRLTDTMGGTTAQKLESFKRQVSMALATVLAEKVLPAITAVASFLADNFGPALSEVGDFLSGTVVPAVRDFASWVDRNQGPLKVVAAVVTGIFLPAMVSMAASAVASGAAVAGAWLMMQIRALAAAALQAPIFLLQIVQWGLTAAAALAGAASIAAAWLISIGPVVLVVAAIAAAVFLIIKYWDDIAAAADWVWEKIKNIWGSIAGFFSGLGSSIAGWFSDAINWLKGAGEAIMNGLWTGIKFIWEAIKFYYIGIPTIIIGYFLDALSWLLEAGKSIMQGLLDGIKFVAQLIWTFYSTVYGTIFNYFVAALTWLLQAGRNIMQGLWDGIVAVWNLTIGWIRQIYGWVLGAFATAGTWLLQAGKWIITSLWDGLKIVWATVTTWFGMLGPWVVGVFANAGSWLLQAGRNVIQGLLSGIQAVWGTANGWIGQIGGFIGNHFAGAGRWLWDAGKSIINGLWDGMKNAWGAVSGWVGSLGGKIKNLKGPLPADKIMLTTEGDAIIGGLLDGMQGRWGEIETWLSGAAGRIQAPMLSASLASAPMRGAGDGATMPVFAPQITFAGPVYADRSGMERLTTEMLPLLQEKWRNYDRSNI
ncbi:phage tail tape measure protein [Parafrankia sp. FMc6]|uniref:phage tail tape measure protein n=1 Tax=Parafrankia soli TaxID=2599596 RepID=UPI0034D6A21B